VPGDVLDALTVDVHLTAIANGIEVLAAGSDHGDYPIRKSKLARQVCTALDRGGLRSRAAFDRARLREIRNRRDALVLAADVGTMHLLPANKG
jgi:hypothetical protein